MPIDPVRLERMRFSATAQPRDFIDVHMLAGEPYAFAVFPDRYEPFREEIGRKLGLGPEAIRLIGSAKLGFSLNRDHLLRLFARESDLDLVVVDSGEFDRAVLELRMRSKDFQLAGQDERSRLRRARDDAFSGYLRPDRLPLSSTLAKAWFPRLAGPFDEPLARTHVVKAWLLCTPFREAVWASP